MQVCEWQDLHGGCGRCSGGGKRRDLHHRLVVSVHMSMYISICLSLCGLMYLHACLFIFVFEMHVRVFGWGVSTVSINVWKPSTPQLWGRHCESNTSGLHLSCFKTATTSVAMSLCKCDRATALENQTEKHSPLLLDSTSGFTAPAYSKIVIAR